VANKGVTQACFRGFGAESVEAAEGLAKDLQADSSDVLQGKDLRRRLDLSQGHGDTEPEMRGTHPPRDLDGCEKKGVAGKGVCKVMKRKE